MSFSAVTARGSATETVSDTSIVLNPLAILTVGKLVFACGVTDNYVTSKGASAEHSIADSKSNAWRKISEYTETDRVAADGVLAERIVRAGLQAYIVMGLRDYGRIDLRVRNGVLYVPDVNANPDITSGAGFAKAAKAVGFSYGEMARQLVDLAAVRGRGIWPGVN